MKPAPLLDDPAQALTSYLEALFRVSPASNEFPPGGDGQATLVSQRAGVAEENHDVVTLTKVPEWAERPFQSLLMEISGATFAMPLTALSGIGKFPEKVRLLPGSAPWEAGIFPGRNGPVMLVDPAKFGLVSNLCPSDNCHVNSPRGKWLVFVGEGRWGFRCDSLKEVVTLEQTQIHWRRSNTCHPWLAGTVKQHLWTLIDMEALVKGLKEGVGVAADSAH